MLYIYAHIYVPLFLKLYIKDVYCSNLVVANIKHIRKEKTAKNHGYTLNLRTSLRKYRIHKLENYATIYKKSKFISKDSEVYL